LTLGRAGARVAICFRTNRIGAQRVVAELKSLGSDGWALGSDVTDSQKTRELVEGVAGRFGRLDILVNNVGDFEWKPVAETSIEEWQAIIASNLFSAFYTSKYALPFMRRQRWGRIINLGSVGAERTFGQAKISAYSAAKSGMVAFSRSLALEEARHGITVNVVNPPVIDDADILREQAERISDARFPVGRPATAQDVAEAVKFFAAEESAFITGQVLNVSGGWML
jgi:3-oxoacyl-[acyl-carrier protein] reductase